MIGGLFERWRNGSERHHWQRLAKEITAIADKRTGSVTLVLTIGDSNEVRAEVWADGVKENTNND